MKINKQTKENIKNFIIWLVSLFLVMVLTILWYKSIAFVILILLFIYIFATLNVILNWIIYWIPVIILYIKNHERIDKLNKETNYKILWNKTLKETIIEHFHDPKFLYEIMS